MNGRAWICPTCSNFTDTTLREIDGPLEKGCSVLWLVLASLALPAQELVLRHIDEERGLPSNFVLDLHVDREGLLWVGTNRGLYRYDGFSFERIGVGTALDRLNVVGMIEGARPGEFIFSCYGHRLFRYLNGEVTEYVNRTAERPLSDAGAYTALVYDADGDLWMALTQGRLAFALDTASGVFRSVLTEEKTPHVRSNGRGFIGRDGLRKHDGTDSLLIILDEQRIRVALSGYINYIGHCPMPMRYPDGDLLISVADMIIRVDPKGEHVERQFRSHVLGYFKDHLGRIWVRVNEHGLFCLDRDLNELPLWSSMLRNDHITDAVEGPRGGMWFSSTTHGLFYCPDPGVGVWSSERVFGVPQVSALAVDSLDQLYVGCSSGLVARLNSDGTTTTIVKAEGRSKGAEVKGLVVLNGRTLIAAGLNNLYDVVSERLTHPENSWRHVALYDAALLSDGRYIFGNTVSCAVTRFPLAFAHSDSLQGHRTFRLLPMGTLDDYWVATHLGLYQYRDGRFVKVDPGDSLLMRRTFDMMALGDTLLLATDRGLVTYRNGKSAVLEPALFPTDVQVRDLYMQPNGHIWCATLNGLYCLRRAAINEPAIRVARPQGLPSDAVYKVDGRADQIWCIVGSDLCSFRPADLDLDRMMGPLTILGFQVGQAFHSGATGYTFDRSVDHLSILLRHVDHTRFNGPAFRYRQAGRNEWTETEHPSVDLISLRPGDHRVEIQAADANGVWGESVFASWTISIPFWNRGWFIAAVVFVSMSAMGLFIVWVQSRRRREAGLRAMAERYHHKALLAQMEPHFLYNALNSIQGFVARNDVDSSQRYLAKFAKLMRGLLQAAHHEQVTLEEEMAMLENYCALEALRSDPPFSFAVKADPGLDTTDILLPSFLMQPYVENAARHGVRNLRDERTGHIEVRFTGIADERLLCEVEDNGVGRERAQQLTDKGAAWRSHGTRINAERAHLLTKGDKNGGVHIMVTDVISAGEVVGTRVSISLPLMRQEKARENGNM